MSSLVFVASSSGNVSTAPTPQVLAAQAVAEHKLSAYYKKWVAANPKLGPAVDAYLTGGSRPSEQAIGNNHYGRALVLTEDIRRG